MRIRFRLSMRARMSSVSSTSCFTAVLIVDSDDAMKSARRPGSVMLVASVCRSSDSSGDSETTCWKFVLMFRASASISSRSASFVPSTAARDLRAEVRLRRHDLVERQRAASPCTIRRRLPSGSLNILWMCVAVPTGYKIGLLRLFDRGVALREDGDQLAVRNRIVDQTDGALARDRERHERIRKEDRVAEREDRQLGRNRERPIAGRTGPQASSSRGDRSWRPHFISSRLVWGKPVEERTWAPPPAEPHDRTPGYLHVEEQRRGAATRRQLTLTLLGDLPRLFAVLAADREGQRAETLLGDFLAAFEAVAVVCPARAAPARRRSC